MPHGMSARRLASSAIQSSNVSGTYPEYMQKQFSIWQGMCCSPYFDMTTVWRVWRINASTSRSSCVLWTCPYSMYVAGRPSGSVLY